MGKKAIQFPGADFRPLGGQTQPRMTSHDIVCLHTMVGLLEGTAAMFKGQGFTGTESHFGVGPRGEVIQWQDLAFTADANLEGNPRVISIETADMGRPFPKWKNSNVPAWTDDQVEALVELVLWLCRRFDIPGRMIPDTKPGRRGIGYHRQGIKGSFKDGLVPGGEKWSESTGKVCPGDRRVAQLKTTIAPRVRAGLRNPGSETIDAQPTVDFARVVRAASASVSPGVRVIERALVAEKLLDESRMDGVWGPRTSSAYAQWQIKCGFTGADADGRPGPDSLTKLGEKHGFLVKKGRR